jgi:dephospho-CoA kinase
VFDIPLLVESPTWRQKVDYVLVVDCTADVQVERVMARNQLTRDDVMKIITSQARRDVRLAAADAILFNVGLTLNKLADEVSQISDRFGLSS